MTTGACSIIGLFCQAIKVYKIKRLRYLKLGSSSKVKLETVGIRSGLKGNEKLSFLSISEKSVIS